MRVADYIASRPRIASAAELRSRKSAERNLARFESVTGITLDVGVDVLDELGRRLARLGEPRWVAGELVNLVAEIGAQAKPVSMSVASKPKPQKPVAVPAAQPPPSEP